MCVVQTVRHCTVFGVEKTPKREEGVNSGNPRPSVISSHIFTSFSSHDSEETRSGRYAISSCCSLTNRQNQALNWPETEFPSIVLRFGFWQDNDSVRENTNSIKTRTDIHRWPSGEDLQVWFFQLCQAQRVYSYLSCSIVNEWQKEPNDGISSRYPHFGLGSDD